MRQPPFTAPGRSGAVLAPSAGPGGAGGNGGRGASRWFERLLAELGQELWIGHPAKIRAAEPRKQKTNDDIHAAGARR